MNGHKNPNDCHNNHDEIEFYQGNSNMSTLWHSTPEQCTLQNQSYRLWWGAILTNVQCHTVLISILWHREYWTIQLKCTLETRQETKTESNHPIHQHGHTNFWYACLSEIVYFDYYNCSYNAWYVCNKWSTRSRTKVVRRKHIFQPTGFGTYSSTCFW